MFVKNNSCFLFYQKITNPYFLQILLLLVLTVIQPIKFVYGEHFIPASISPDNEVIEEEPNGIIDFR